jgi:hypothetical protein
MGNGTSICTIKQKVVNGIFQTLHTYKFFVEYTYHGKTSFDARRIDTRTAIQDGSADISLRQ